MSSFHLMTRSRAECKVDEFIDDGNVITIPNASIVIKNRELFYELKNNYKNAGNVLDIFLAVGMSFMNIVLKNTDLTVDQILERIIITEADP